MWCYRRVVLTMAVLLEASAAASGVNSSVRMATPSTKSTATYLDKTAAALDSLWLNYWNEHEKYLALDAIPQHRTAAAAGIGNNRGGPLLPFWNYQESIHAFALGASLNYTEYGKKLKTMVEGQAAMNSTRQRGTGSDGWTRDYFDVRDASAGGADGVGGSI